jgi:hypothetical protein
MHRNPNTRYAYAMAAIAACLIGVTAPRTAAANDKVPNLNIEPSCRYQSRMSTDAKVGYERCMDQEQNAKVQLEKNWAQYAPQDRSHCLDMTNELGGSTASYVEVLECVIMTRDARAFEKKFPSDMDVSIGQGK